MTTTAQLDCFRSTLHSIYTSISDFRFTPSQPHILDSSTDALLDAEQSGELLPGLKQLRDSVKIDLDALERFLEHPSRESLPPLSTNAPYLIAVWNEITRAPPPLVSVMKAFAGLPSALDKKSKTTPNLVKVDVVADGGCRWIRVNTIKNSRILFEFCEMDSYLTDSDSEDDQTPSLAQTEFDNSIIRMARSLLAAANTNLIDSAPPSITLCLTRLEPEGSDPRIAQTVSVIRDMGIEVLLGERDAGIVPSIAPTPTIHLSPTINVNLDLSVLIAFVSDLTHSPLPTSVEEAQARFLTPRPSERESEPTVQSRALTNQIMQEMLQEMGRGGMFQELHHRLQGPFKLWTTSEARDRFIRIVAKIGGPGEKKRAAVLFAAPELTREEAEERFWEGSRFQCGFIPCLPINVYSDDTISSPPSLNRSSFFVAMEKTCVEILALGLAHQSSPLNAVKKKTKADAKFSNNGFLRNPSSERAIPTKANAKLTEHTVHSMWCGALRGWTTLTANRSSVKALLRELRVLRPGYGGVPEGGQQDAVVWIVDPRSLAESTRARVNLQAGNTHPAS
ncbi:hypothetical protein MIND_01193000 [Mycena indigotica]|uniref:DUF1308 domain-containing protein n=1 Tax=Mycena indigotica TaxID=2126181 RepID=A0A8H6VWP9_9AGAR|nr:uncharacterized protein MIND_01193000 [Mycena indigotica]KAF7292938.1 hypothetical protein MIND_01193000 [Mycena indigotica]